MSDKDRICFVLHSVAIVALAIGAIISSSNTSNLEERIETLEHNRQVQADQILRLELSVNNLHEKEPCCDL